MADDTTGGSAPAFTDQQVESLKSLVGGIVNATIRKRDEMSDKKRAEDREVVKGEFAKLLDEKFQSFKPSEVDDKDGKSGKRSKDDDVRVATLAKQLEEERRAREAWQERSRASEQRRREGDRQRIVMETLAKGGISDPFKQELALSYLDRKQRVAWSGEEEDATLLWKSDEGEVSYQEGIRSWLKSEEAKHFLPPTATRGSGSRPGTAPIAGQTVSREQAQANGLQFLAKALQKELHGIDTDES